MRIAFAGTPEFAAASLEALLAARHEVTLVLTQPDRPAGRGLTPQRSAVMRLAERRGLRVMQPPTLKRADVLAAVTAAAPEAIVVAAYGLILPGALLRVAPRGCLNVHASLLPRWRGAAPIQRALLAGDAVTGVTIMQMHEGVDTGPILLQEAIPIAVDDTAGTLHDKLAALGAELIVRALGSAPAPRSQGESGVTYAARVAKRDAEIDWRQPAVSIERQVRAFNPVPGAQTQIGGVVLKIWRARAETGMAGEPGKICAADAAGVMIACGSDALRVTELQRAGGKRLPARTFLSGFKLTPGMRFGSGDG